MFEFLDGADGLYAFYQYDVGLQECLEVAIVVGEGLAVKKRPEPIV